MKVLVTGAAGFIGGGLLGALAARGVQWLRCDVAEAGARATLVSRDLDAVFHLAALVSNGAQRDFELGTRINLEAMRELLEPCRLAGHCPRFVFSSSIAVYGGTLPNPVTHATPTVAAHLLRRAQARRRGARQRLHGRGYVDGRVLRLPTVMVHLGAANSAVSGWASALVRDYVCPVRGDTRMACLSLGLTVDARLRAAALAPEELGFERARLPAGISISAREMWESVRWRGAGRGLGRVVVELQPARQRVTDGVPRATGSVAPRGSVFAPTPRSTRLPTNTSPCSGARCAWRGLQAKMRTYIIRESISMQRTQKVPTLQRQSDSTGAAQCRCTLASGADCTS